jgi:hypothetical protein
MYAQRVFNRKNFSSEITRILSNALGAPSWWIIPFLIELFDYYFWRRRVFVGMPWGKKWRNRLGNKWWKISLEWGFLSPWRARSGRWSCRSPLWAPRGCLRYSLE